MRSFAGIGSREWSPEQLSRITSLSSRLSEHFEYLHSGNANGSDFAFAMGFPSERVILHVPWWSYNRVNIELQNCVRELDPKFIPLASEIWNKYYTDRPLFCELKQSVQKLMARNYSIVEGVDEVYAAPGVIVGVRDWSDTDSYTGGTKFGIVLARELKKPVHILDMRQYVIRKNVFGV